MQTLTVQINNISALKTLKALEEKNYIKILKSPSLASPSLTGKAKELTAFEAWISDAENAPSLTLKEAKSIWASKKK